MKTGLGDPQGDSVLPDVGSLSPQSELKSIGAQILIFQVFLINSVLTAFFYFLIFVL